MFWRMVAKELLKRRWGFLFSTLAVAVAVGAWVMTDSVTASLTAEADELGRQAEPYMKAGRLVPDLLLNPILEERLSQPDCERGFILDGYPRTVAQAEALDALLKGKGLPTHLFLIDVPTERLFKLLTGRRLCPRCHRNYNIYFQPPKKEGVCDVDGTPLVQRPDDREEVIRQRFETYQKETQLAVDHYARQGHLIHINGDQTPEKVAAEINSKLTSQ
jgi:adenylate kinase